MSVETIIKLENVVKVFHNLEVIHNCNMNVPKGAIYGFVGANGAGKTTILKLIMGLLNPISGEITVMGNHIPAERHKILKKIGSIIETPIFYDHLSAEENLRLHLEYMQVPATIEIIQAALHKVGLNGVGTQSVDRFSLGMKQRLGLSLIHI